MSNLYYANLPEIKNYKKLIQQIDYHIGHYRRFLRKAINLEKKRELKLKWRVLDRKTIKEIYENEYSSYLLNKNPDFSKNFKKLNEYLKTFPNKKKELKKYIQNEIAKIKRKKYIWIEILEEESSIKEKKIINSLFRSKDIIYDNNKRDIKINIIKKESNFNAILIDKKPNSEYIFIEPNVITLKRQLEAIKDLKDHPRQYLYPLLKLFENVNYVEWPSFNLEEIDKWFLLKDDNFESVEQQREFVRKALSTPDFIILEGPPGSGKTHSICELILQLITRKKRVLLCASTHVAVDNVLEKLKEENSECLIAVRIGDSINISEKVKEYQIEKLATFEKNKIIENLKKNKKRLEAQNYFLETLESENGEKVIKNLFLDHANLICGTTIGFLRYHSLKYKNSPSKPYFDYLILDEASKTTFQEFLVPAIHCEKWIIVGDPKQLSPYIDAEDIEANLKHLLNENDAEICINVFNCYRKSKKVRNALNMLVIEDDHIIRKKYEIQAQKLNLRVINIDNHNLDINDFKLKLELLGSQIIIGSLRSLKKLEDYLPMDIEIIIGKHDLNNFLRRRKFWIKNIKIHSEDRSTKWAYELAWRLIRDFELRKSNDRIDKYKEDIEALIPQWDNEEDLVNNDGMLKISNENNQKNKIRDEIDLIRKILLPSIIECLIEGVGKQYQQKSPTTLSEGFKDDDKKMRYVLLEYQYRMHPDISNFPRKYIYYNRALKDSKQINRELPFNPFNIDYRVIWYNVKGNMDETNKNIEEAKKIIDVLKKYNKHLKVNYKNNKTWKIAILTFYAEQERYLRSLLQELFDTKKVNLFENKDGTLIVELCTVDRFQGHEADIVFLSMVRTKGEGFLNSINRLNVAITRAKYQLIIFGAKKNFYNKKRAKILQELSKYAKEIYTD
ncbi:MAG: AAA domain-containing protein [Promethearchaeota archaeon]